MAASNPNPTRIPAPCWAFWLAFDKLESSAQLGGIFAPKGGYHNYRGALKSGDYSVGQVANDRLGLTAVASAIDLTMSSAAMIRYTTRLDKACRARDPRLFVGGEPTIREFIGTKDGRVVYCYVLTGGRALGVGADAGPDPGRDKTHLWHIHISMIRKFAANSAAWQQLYSIISGETLAAWKKRTAPPKPPAPVTPPKPPVVTIPKPPATPTVPGTPTVPAIPTVPAPPAPPATPALKEYALGSRVLEHLDPNMSGTDVLFVQRYAGGVAHFGVPDGIAGPQFKLGVQRYQRIRGLTPDGVVGPATWADMGVK